MKLGIINGSHRKNSQGDRVSKVLIEREDLSSSFGTMQYFNLQELDIPLWDETAWENHEKWANWNTTSSGLKECDAFIVVVPEWGGMVPPGLKNLLLLASPEELGHKPALIVSISTGLGGANPVSELRASGYKNNHICYLPDHIILRGVDKFFDKSDLERNEEVMERLSYTLSLLTEYSTALKGLRSNFKFDDRFQYGMS